MLNLKKWVAIATIISVFGMAGCTPAAQDGGTPPAGSAAGSNSASSSAGAATGADEFPALFQRHAKP